MPARGLGAGAPFTDRETEARGRVRVSPALWGRTDSNPGCVAGSHVLCLPINTHRDHSSHMGSCPALSKARGRCGHFPSEDQGSERPETPGTSRPPAPRLVHGQQALWGRARPQEETEGRRGPAAPDRRVCPGLSLSRPSGQLRSSSRRPDVHTQAPARRVSVQGQWPPAPASVSGLRDKEGLL